METKELKDYEVLINIFFPFAEEMLRKYGEFHPYAGAINNEGEVVSVGQYNSDESAEPENMISNLKNSLRLKKDNFKVGIIFYDVRTTDSVTNETTDAIAVFVEHKEGESAYEFFYPYKLSGKEELNIDEGFGNKIPREIF